MSEEVINYSGSDHLNWLQRKKKGLSNRYYKYRRYFLWWIHVRLNHIAPDFSKIKPTSTPIIINNFNRLELLKAQLDWLKTLSDEISIIILDNKSDYPPLLDFYKELDHPSIQVIMLNFNSWRKGAEHIANLLLKKFENVVITDSDLLPYSTTPKDLVSYLAQLMLKYPTVNHIGTSLAINDLPEHNPLKATIINYEKEFWPPVAKKAGTDGYFGKIDTTFAMYRKGSKILATEPAIRTVPPYCLKHEDWYLDPNKYSEEHQYYFDSCKSFATWAHEQKRKNKV